MSKTIIFLLYFLPLCFHHSVSCVINYTPNHKTWNKLWCTVILSGFLKVLNHGFAASFSRVLTHGGILQSVRNDPRLSPQKRTHRSKRIDESVLSASLVLGLLRLPSGPASHRKVIPPPPCPARRRAPHAWSAAASRAAGPVPESWLHPCSIS